MLNKNSQTNTVEIIEKTTYYKCDKNSEIEDAFNIKNFSKENKIIFTEGETDEEYLKKAMKIFFRDEFDFSFEWIGKYDKSGNAINTGCTGLNNLLKVIEANENLFEVKIGLLYDCDTNKLIANNDKYFIYTLKQNQNKRFEIGIENLLNLPSDFKYNDFLKSNHKKDKYGFESKIDELDKVKLCEYICSSDKNKEYLINLKTLLEDLKKLMDN